MRSARTRAMPASLLVGACLLWLGPLGGVARGATYVRVDQLGYAAAASKRAYLMSSTPQAGTGFAIETLGGQVVYAGTVGTSSGAWSPAYGYVYPLDFDAVRRRGSFRVVVRTVPATASLPFPIASAPTLYEPALANTLSFYETERDGPDYIHSPLRAAPAHLNDEHAQTYVTPKVNEAGDFAGELEGLGRTLDASGGWWDAGDYLKFVQTESYTVDVMLAGLRDFPALMGASARSHDADFTEEARFGVEWLLKMWDDATGTLYYQVGIGEGNAATIGDHDIWRLPQADDSYGGSSALYRFIRHRPVFRAGPPGAPVSPNLAGRMAAAFALCFQDFHRLASALADRCLRAGEDIFALADTSPKGRLLTVIPFGFYPETEWRDDLELGASELASALQSGGTLPTGLPHREAAFYLGDAAEWAAAYLKHAAAHGSEGLNLYDVSGLADYELVRALRRAGATGLAVDEAALVEGLGTKLEEARARGARDPFGFGFPWAQADTSSHGDGLAVMAAEYDWLTGSSAYAGEQSRWLGNVLGANAWGASMIIGDGSVFPDCPQHQVANLAGSLDGTPPVLAGAVVEGPSNEPSSGEVEGMRACGEGPGRDFVQFNGHGALFKDEMQSYTTVEPAIDLTASSMLAFSWAAAGAPAAQR